MLLYLRHLLITSLSVFMFFSTSLYSSEMTQEERTQITAKMIPIITMLLSGDSTPPTVPTLTANAPTESLDGSLTVEVNGEPGSKVYVNGIYVATVGADGTVLITLDLSNGDNRFSIVLKDDSGNESDALEFNVTQIDVKIVIKDGTMQKIPFDFNATVENLPTYLNVQWYIDGNATEGMQYRFEIEGTYYVSAKIVDAENKTVKLLNTDIVAFDTKLVTSFNAKEGNETSTYVYSDQNSTLSGVSILVQEDSLLEDTLIELKESEAPNIPNLGRPAISKVLSLEPSGLQFEKPILVSIPYTGEVKKDNIMIARYSEGGVVDTILPYSVNEQDKVVTFKTDHFTSFSLQEGWNLIDDPIDEQTVIQRIIEVTGITESTYTNDEWSQILNSVIIEEGSYTVYDMFLEYDGQKRMADEVVVFNYAKAIRAIFPESKSTLEKQVATMKSISDTLGYIETFTSFDPRQIVAGGADMLSEIISASGSLLGLPTSVYDIASPSNYISKPLDIVGNSFLDIDNLFYETLWEELEDILTYGGDEDDVMAYDVQNSAILSSFIQDDNPLLSKDMIHNLKLIFLKNIHFQEHQSTYLHNLITTMHYYYEADEKSVRVLPKNHQSFFVNSVRENFYPEFNVYTRGYSQDSFLDKNAHVTLYNQGVELGRLYFNYKNEDGSYFTGSFLNSFSEAGNYVLDWKYDDSEGVEKEGKYYVKFIEPYHTTLTDYKIVSNNIDNDEGYIRIAPVFSTNDYIGYTTEIQLGETTLTQEYKTGIKIPYYADILAGELGDEKLNELKNVKVKFTNQPSSGYIFDTKEFTIDLFEYALNGESGIFDSLNIQLAEIHDTVLPDAYVSLKVYMPDSDVVPIAIDYEGDGIYDKVLGQSNINEWGELRTVASYSKKGVYKPCIRFHHSPTKLRKNMCYDYDITITDEDEPVVELVEVPGLIASKTSVSEGEVVTFTLDITNVSSVGTIDMDGEIILQEENNGEIVIEVRYANQGVFSPYMNVFLTDGTVKKIESQFIKVGGNTGTITHNNTTYGTVTSPYTGKVWLDRNLGASQVCTAFDDPDCYGDYYQWGRNYDGHQDSASATTGTQASDVNAAGSSFIVGSSDWASVDSSGTTRTANWSATDGPSVCPVGFRVPTLTELKAETLDNGVTNSATAFTNFLRLPSAGYRYYSSGSLYGQGSWGYVWSSSVYGSSSHYVYFASGDANSNYGIRASGFTVRCLRD